MKMSFDNPDIGSKIKELIPTETIPLSQGRDHLDYISWDRYNSYDYWTGLAYYNNIINPFNLIDQGITTLKLFDKSEFDLLMKEIEDV